MERHFLALTSFSFYRDTDKPKYWISRDLKNRANLFKNNLNKTRINMKFQIKKREWWNRGITNTKIFPKKAFNEGTEAFLSKKKEGCSKLKD